jgi:hypothetical protein
MRIVRVHLINYEVAAAGGGSGDAGSTLGLRLGGCHPPRLRCEFDHDRDAGVEPVAV